MFAAHSNWVSVLSFAQHDKETIQEPLKGYQVLLSTKRQYSLHPALVCVCVCVLLSSAHLATSFQSLPFMQGGEGTGRRFFWWALPVMWQLVSFSKPASEVLNEYSRKVDFLKGLLEAEKLVRPFFLTCLPRLTFCCE